MQSQLCAGDSLLVELSCTKRISSCSNSVSKFWSMIFSIWFFKFSSISKVETLSLTLQYLAINPDLPHLKHTSEEAWGETWDLVVLELVLLKGFEDFEKLTLLLIEGVFEYG